MRYLMHDLSKSNPSQTRSAQAFAGAATVERDQHQFLQEPDLSNFPRLTKKSFGAEGWNWQDGLVQRDGRLNTRSPTLARDLLHPAVANFQQS